MKSRKFKMCHCFENSKNGFNFNFLQEIQDTNQYVKSEIEALDREQKQIDERAANLEEQLRAVMKKGKGLILMTKRKKRKNN